MPLAARILFGAFGLVVAVYAAASLSGNWLSTPPWWTVERPGIVFTITPDHGPPRTVTYTGSMRIVGPMGPLPLCRDEPRPGRELISVGVGAVGIAALAFSSWPRRKPGSA